MIGGHESLRSGGGTVAARTPASHSTSRTTAPTRTSNQMKPTTQNNNNNNNTNNNNNSKAAGLAGTTGATAGKGTLTTPLRGQWVAQAIAPTLYGRRAAAWITVWDKASVPRRTAILVALKSLHADSNNSALDDDLGDAAPLLFARLTSWWKLRYGGWVAEANAAARAAQAKSKAGVAAPTPPLPEATPSSSSFPLSSASASHSAELLAQVEAITIFVRGSRFLLQFVEGGGVAALCDCLEATASLSPFSLDTSDPPRSFSVPPETPTARREVIDGYAPERRAIALLLLHIANSGRVYREMVGDVENLVHLLHALLRETDATVANPITELLAMLNKGHPRLSTAVQTGLVRVLARALPASEETDALPPQPSSPSSALPVSDTPTVVVLSTARAIRALQLQAEQQHYSQFAACTGGVGDAGSAVLASAGAVDYVPVIGLDSTITGNSFAAAGAGVVAVCTQDPLLRPFTVTEYLDTLFRLALDGQHTAYRVEGNELLNLAAKNIQLTPKILTRCLDVVDDDVYTIEGAGEGGEEGVGVTAGGGGIAPSQLRRQRRQLSCGRAAVLILISRPMTAERRDLLLRLIAQRGGHLTLLKYLRLTQHGDTAAVVDCCHALQFLARAVMKTLRRRLNQPVVSAVPSRTAGAETMLERMTEGIQAALGEAVFQQLLFQELSEEDCLAVLRSARAAVVGRVE